MYPCNNFLYFYISIFLYFYIFLYFSIFFYIFLYFSIFLYWQSPEKAAEEVNPLVDEDVSMIPVYEVSDYYMNLMGGGAGDAPLALKRKKVKDVILCRISTNDTNVCKLFTGCPRSVFIFFYVFSICFYIFMFYIF